MNIQPGRVAGSVIAAIALMLCLGLLLAGAMVLGRSGDAIKAGKDAAQDTGCQFTAASEQLIVYQAPIQALSQQKVTVLGGGTYPIIKQNNGFYLLQLAESDSGWANNQDGTTGGDCGDISIDDTPLANFPTVCAFTNPQEVTLYSKPDLVTVMGTVAPGSYLIESTTGNQYYIVLDEHNRGWVAVAAGHIAGACGSLPVALG